MSSKYFFCIASVLRPRTDPSLLPHISTKYLHTVAQRVSMNA